MIAKVIFYQSEGAMERKKIESYLIGLSQNEEEIEVKNDNNKFVYKFNKKFVVNDSGEACDNWGVDIKGNIFVFDTLLSVKYKCYNICEY